ncbi:MAG: EpsI family protein [Methanosarcinales archaeon]|nr:EpsI family protein [Methanosarcinales archaeon]
MFRTAEIQKDPIALIGIILLAYVLLFLFAPHDIMDFTVVDTEYWHETENRMIVKSAYDYNNKESIEQFPATLDDWSSFDYKYSDVVYDNLNAEAVLTRGYKNENDLVWMDIIHSKVGESFHKQKICVEGGGWTVVNESVVRIDIGASKYNPYTFLCANRLDIEKDGRKQVMMYWFLFKKFGSSNAVTMIRLSSPVSNDYSETFDTMSQFVRDQLFEEMYENVGKTPTVIEMLFYGNKILAAVVIFLALFIPLGLIFNRKILKKR